MILETIVTTQNSTGYAHIAPMGIHVMGEELAILPFRPSQTLENLTSNPSAVINCCDDVRIFAGCLTGKRDWPLIPAERVPGNALASALSYREVEVIRVIDDPVRPQFICRSVHEVNRLPFRGFNRAQFSVIEAAILVSRIGMLPGERVAAEISYLRTGMEKTAGPKEWEAWNWLMEYINAYRDGES